jgi:hypothetical protein
LNRATGAFAELAQPLSGVMLGFALLLERLVVSCDVRPAKLVTIIPEEGVQDNSPSVNHKSQIDFLVSLGGVKTLSRFF